MGLVCRRRRPLPCPLLPEGHPLPGSLQCQKEMLPGGGGGACAPATSARLALTITGLLDHAATRLSHTGIKRAHLCVSSQPDSQAAELSG